MLSVDKLAYAKPKKPPQVSVSHLLSCPFASSKQTDGKWQAES